MSSEVNYILNIDKELTHNSPCSGPMCDAGLTGRKIIVDTYGSGGTHGGGAFSGKDYTKVKRSAAYSARWVAKSLVSARLVRRCLVQQVSQISIFHCRCDLDKFRIILVH